MISSESAQLINVQSPDQILSTSDSIIPKSKLFQKSGDDLSLILVLIASIVKRSWHNYCMQLLQIGLSSA